jgi:hypothetical protein
MATAVDLAEAQSSPPAEAASFSPQTWACWHSNTNGALAATHAAKAGMQHMVTQIIIAADGAWAAAATFTLKDNASTLLLTIPWATVDRKFTLNIPGAGIPITQGNSVDIAMDSTGGATIGMIYASGYTVRAP